MSTSLLSPEAARMPQFSVNKSRHSSTISIGPWSITATKKPILNGKEIEAAEKSLNLPLPEMTFGNNSLELNYRTTDEGQESLLSFDAIGALAGVATGEGWEERVGGGVKVSMAETWGKNRSSPSALLSDTPLPSKPVKPHDWTYSTCYAGSIAGPSNFQPSSSSSIPMKLLARQDPVLDQILFYEDVPLFEDELHDNGESILNVRIRIMPHSFFILARLFLRVDNVLFRIHDVRVYHSFGSNEVIREVFGMEVDYEDVKQRLEKPSDLSPLTDPNFVYMTMSTMTESQGKTVDGKPTLTHRSSSRTTGRPWPGLGKRTEVLVLPLETTATDEMKKLSI